jgi:hypothetical protein
MAKTLTAASVADEEQYIVQLTRTIKLGRSYLRPGDAEVRLSGKAIKENADAIGAISKVPE